VAQRSGKRLGNRGHGNCKRKPGSSGLEVKKSEKKGLKDRGHEKTYEQLRGQKKNIKRCAKSGEKGVLRSEVIKKRVAGQRSGEEGLRRKSN